MDKLKRCPFCGGKPNIEYCGPGVYISCRNDDCPCICEAWGENEDMAEEAWNTRATDAENAKLRELAVGMARRVTNPTGGCLAPGCALGCPHHLECNEELHTCWYVDRMRELGIEVE